MKEQVGDVFSRGGWNGWVNILLGIVDAFQKECLDCDGVVASGEEAIQ